MISEEIKILSKLIILKRMNIYCLYTRKLIIETYFPVDNITINLRKYIKTRCQETYLDILNSYLLAYSPYLLLAKYRIAKIKRVEGRVHILFR